jgi:ATP-dependent RNA helicase RhlE
LGANSALLNQKMNQNSSRGGGARHPRSPLPKHTSTPQTSARAPQPNPRAPQRSRTSPTTPSALFTAPPKQVRNWLDGDARSAAPREANQQRRAASDQSSVPVSHQLVNEPPVSLGHQGNNASVVTNNKNSEGAQANSGLNAIARSAQLNAPRSDSPQPRSAPAPADVVRADAPSKPQTHTPATTDEGFAALGLREELVRAVLAHGYSSPTPIQRQGIPAVLDGGDLLGGAQTGTGKTAGFVLPMLQRLMQLPQAKRGNSTLPRALILAPTRELAAQVEESVRIYGKFLPLTSTCIFGGVNINPQITAMRRGVDVVVATPGRLLDLHQQRAIDLSAIQILVLDEADRMLDMGFIHDIKKVLAVLPPKRQNLLFSATFSDDIKALTDRLLNNPRMIEVARRNTTIEVVDQSVVLVDKSAKAKLLIHLIKERQWFQVLVFTRTKHGANRLAEQLTKSGIPAMAIHGNKSQGARTKALAEFKSNTLQVLVATDIAARGIDIDQLPHVVNYELPNVPEDYVHRIGRTGRAGATGEAMSLVMAEELPLLKDIEKFTKQSIARVKIDGFDPSKIPDPVAPTSEARDAEWQARGGRPAPRVRSGGGGGRGNGGAAPRSGASAPPRSGTSAPPRNSAAAPRPAGGGQGRSSPRGGGRGR